MSMKRMLCVVSLLAVGYGGAMVKHQEQVVTFDRKAAAEIMKNLETYQRKDYYIPLPVRYAHCTKDNECNAHIIYDYNNDPIYNKEKQCLEIWGYTYHAQTGKPVTETKYAIYDVTQQDIEQFFGKLPSLIGFEDFSKTISTSFQADMAYQERPPYVINREDKKLIIYDGALKHVRPFTYILWDDKNNKILSKGGADPITLSKELFLKIKYDCENPQQENKILLVHVPQQQEKKEISPETTSEPKQQKNTTTYVSDTQTEYTSSPLGTSKLSASVNEELEEEEFSLIPSEITEEVPATSHFHNVTDAVLDTHSVLEYVTLPNILIVLLMFYSWGQR
jgi:hypothetical protein